MQILAYISLKVLFVSLVLNTNSTCYGFNVQNYWKKIYLTLNGTIRHKCLSICWNYWISVQSVRNLFVASCQW